MSKKNRNKVKESKGFSMKEYFSGVSEELSKVAFPDRERVIKDTVVVIAVCAFFGVFFWAINTGVLALFTKIIH